MCNVMQIKTEQGTYDESKQEIVVHEKTKQ